MTLATSPGEAYAIYSPGPAAQRLVPAAEIGFAGTTIAASGTLTSALIFTEGMKDFALGVKSTQGGTLSVQRYIDQGGSVVQGAALTTTLTANTQATLNQTDSNPFQALEISIINGGSVAATISNLALLLQAQ